MVQGYCVSNKEIVTTFQRNQYDYLVNNINPAPYKQLMNKTSSYILTLQASLLELQCSPSVYNAQYSIHQGTLSVNEVVQMLSEKTNSEMVVFAKDD